MWVLLAYAAGLVALGAWVGLRGSRRVAAAGSFFVADRKLGPVLLFATVLAANLGAGTTVGAAGLGYRDGLSAWWWVGSAGIGTILLALWVGPRIWRIAARHGLLTMGDYLDLRYGRSVRLLIAVLLWFATLTIVSGQLIAMAEIVAVVAGTPRWIGALLGGVVVIVYFSAGGLVASAWVNLVQLVVLLAGFAVAIPWALSDIGGWAAIEADRCPHVAGLPESVAGRGIRVGLHRPPRARLHHLARGSYRRSTEPRVPGRSGSDSSPPASGSCCSPSRRRCSG